MIEYLLDARALLAEHAHSEFTAISGEEFGTDETAWLNWLQRNRSRLEPMPAAVASDPVAAWGQEILITDELPGLRLATSMGRQKGTH